MTSLSIVKVFYSIVAAIVTLCGYLISYFMNFETMKDLAEIFIGSLMISIGTVDMTIDSQAYCTDKYPYSYFISLITFAGLTFYTFIKESVALLDDSLLLPCDMTKPMFVEDSIQDEQITSTEVPEKFTFSGNFIYIILYAISCIECLSFGSVISAFKDLENINGRLPFILITRLLQTVCIAYFLKRMDLHWGVFAALGTINATLCLPFGLIEQVMSDRAIDIFFAVASAILLGYFLYFGSTSIHNSRITHIHPNYTSIIASLIGFSIPILIRVFVKDPSI